MDLSLLSDPPGSRGGFCESCKPFWRSKDNCVDGLRLGDSDAASEGALERVVGVVLLRFGS